MAKKKHHPGVSGNPAKRAQQEAIQEVLNAHPQLAEYGRRSHELDVWSTDSLLFFDAAANDALTSRGWTAEEPDGGSGDIWGWEPSTIEPDHDTETYYEVTSVYPREYGLAVDLAGPADGPWSGARYSTLERLLADIDAIESFRHGDPFPYLPHAMETAEGLPAPLSVRREEGTASE